MKAVAPCVCVCVHTFVHAQNFRPGKSHFLDLSIGQAGPPDTLPDWAGMD